MKLSRLVAVFFLAVATTSAASAQLPALDPLAAPLAEVLVKAKQKSLIVLDFSGPGGQDTALGQALAEKFSIALSKSSDKFSVAARGAINESLARKALPPTGFNDIGLALMAASEFKIESVVIGEIKLAGDGLGIKVDCYRVDSGKWISGFNTTSTITAEMRDLMNKVVEYRPLQPDPTIPVSGKNGYTYPTCVQCPPVQYDKHAAPHHYVGAVTLSAVIKTDGSTSDVVVLKAIPYGLTAKAIEAVKSWKFKPAQDPRGNLADVRQVISVTFHID
jgi:TonB family protein